MWGLYLQSRHEQLVDIFYRSTHWNISQVMLESQRFLYDLRLYRADGLDMETLSLDYDLLWNRLDVFLVGTETADARARHGLGEVLTRLFDTDQDAGPQVQAGALQRARPSIGRWSGIADLTRQVELIGDQILSGQEREASLSQLRQGACSGSRSGS